MERYHLDRFEPVSPIMAAMRRRPKFDAVGQMKRGVLQVQPERKKHRRASHFMIPASLPGCRPNVGAKQHDQQLPCSPTGTPLRRGRIPRQDALLARRGAFAQIARGTIGALPERGEFFIRNAHVLSMEQSLGDMPGADIHLRGGVILAVGHGLQAPGAEVIDASDMIAIPGLIDTHWHMWGSVARNMAGDDAKTGYYLFARAVGDVFTPEDNARGACACHWQKRSTAGSRQSTIGRTTW